MSIQSGRNYFFHGRTSSKAFYAMHAQIQDIVLLHAKSVKKLANILQETTETVGLLKLLENSSLNLLIKQSIFREIILLENSNYRQKFVGWLNDLRRQFSSIPTNIRPLRLKG